jgi:hypothetical protein
VLRVVLPWIDLDGLLNTAIEQIRAYAVTDAAVSLRLLRLLHDVAVTIDNDALRLRIVARRARRGRLPRSAARRRSLTVGAAAGGAGSAVPGRQGPPAAGILPPGGASAPRHG